MAITGELSNMREDHRHGSGARERGTETEQSFWEVGDKGKGGGTRGIVSSPATLHTNVMSPDSGSDIN